MALRKSLVKFMPVVALSALTLALFGCDRGPVLPESAGYGPNPQLPEPRPTPSWWPHVNVAKAVGWGKDEAPTPAAGLRVNAFATGLTHPRWLYELPNGDILVAETDTPPTPAEKHEGLRGFVQGLIMKRAGANHPSPDRIVLLRDTHGDGVADQRFVLLENLHSPFGMALIGDQLYVADAVVHAPYVAGETRIAATPQKLVDLPAGRNHHWTKSLVADKQGSRLYVGVGSNSNVAEHGMTEETDRAAIHEIDPANGKMQLYASGLRNPVGMDWNPETGDLWVSVNERDEIGDNLVPDYMTSVKPGGFYGWPYSYYGQHIDERVQPQNPTLVASAIKPDYALGSHTASLGFTFVDDARFGEAYKGGAAPAIA